MKIPVSISHDLQVSSLVVSPVLSTSLVFKKKKKAAKLNVFHSTMYTYSLIQGIFIEYHWVQSPDPTFKDFII